MGNCLHFCVTSKDFFKICDDLKCPLNANLQKDSTMVPTSFGRLRHVACLGVRNDIVTYLKPGPPIRNIVGTARTTSGRSQDAE